MGRRKLWFDRHKNTERRRRPPPLVVCIPLHVLPPTELIVCLPLATFLSALVPSAQSLLSRLRESGRLPPKWTVAIGVSEHFALTQLHLSPLTLESVSIVLRVQSHCSWTLSLGGSELTPQNCQLVAGVGSTLRSVAAVVALLSILDSAVWCGENSDQRFQLLVDHHKDGVELFLGCSWIPTLLLYLQSHTCTRHFPKSYHLI